jgi:hypothetical protein
VTDRGSCVTAVSCYAVAPSENAKPNSHVFGRTDDEEGGCGCVTAGLKGWRQYVLAYGIRVSDHAEVSLRTCHRDYTLSLVSKSPKTGLTTITP